LQKNILNINSLAKNLSHYQGLNQFCVFFIYNFIFLGLAILGQAETHVERESSSSICNVVGSTIYFINDSFHQQILCEKVNKVGSKTKHIVSGSGKKILLSKILHQNMSRNDSKATSKEVEGNKQRWILEVVKEKIAQFEEQKKALDFKDFDFLPGSGQFLIGCPSATVFVLPSTHLQAFSNEKRTQDEHASKKNFEYIHSQKNTYNCRSLYCCLLEVFSVRPPPVEI